jgi:hypothetical protein
LAGYSATPLAKKLGFKENFRAALVRAPRGFGATLGELPEGVRFVGPTRRPLDLILLFIGRRALLERDFPKLAPRLAPAGMLWVAWPKKASGVETDLTETVVRETGLALGLVDTKVCAIDETWSGLRFVVRLKDRPRG